MSYKFDSLMIILNKLDSMEKVTVSSLSTELEVSERSIHRYMNTLLVAGFPIIYDRNKNSYIFEEGYSMKKPDLSIEETLAFALAGKFLVNYGSGMEKSLQNIKMKLSSRTSGDMKHIILSDESLPSLSAQYLSLIHNAIINYRKIKILYKSLNADKPAESKVDPYYLFFREGIWYLRGWYYIYSAARTFALDRILSLSVLNEHYVPQHVSPEDELSSAFGAFIDGKPVTVVLRFAAERRPFILRKKWHKSQKIVEMEDGQIEMTLTVNGLLGIKNWLYQWIPYVKVIAPEELKDTLKADLLAELAFIDS
ncbi:MAG: WYL domain-containing transcriptional regulator [Proteobacteria bacterium]|nr:WYL domain-containing transcriptional regulator [Pseudomonadota bacterium]